MSLKILGLLSVLSLVSGEHSRDSSSILSRLYQKAANENRPLILILDDTLKNQNHPHVHSHPLDREYSLSASLLDLLNNKRQSLKINKQSFADRPVEFISEAKTNNDLLGLKQRLEKEKLLRQERRERRERRERFQARYSDRIFDMKERKRHQHKYDRENMQSNRDDDEQRTQESDDKLVLRSSVIKNLLRISNDLNCDAKEECHDRCDNKYNGNKKDECENVCEVKYDCQESDKESDPCDADSGGCGDSEEKTGSTKGELHVNVTPKCKRC